MSTLLGVVNRIARLAATFRVCLLLIEVVYPQSDVAAVV
jgi:hypothetical protein